MKNPALSRRRTATLILVILFLFFARPTLWAQETRDQEHLTGFLDMLSKMESGRSHRLSEAHRYKMSLPSESSRPNSENTAAPTQIPTGIDPPPYTAPAAYPHDGVYAPKKPWKAYVFGGDPSLLPLEDLPASENTSETLQPITPPSANTPPKEAVEPPTPHPSQAGTFSESIPSQKTVPPLALLEHSPPLANMTDSKPGSPLDTFDRLLLYQISKKGKRLAAAQKRGFILPSLEKGSLKTPKSAEKLLQFYQYLSNRPPINLNVEKFFSLPPAPHALASSTEIKSDHGNKSKSRKHKKKRKHKKQGKPTKMKQPPLSPSVPSKGPPQKKETPVAPSSGPKAPGLGVEGEIKETPKPPEIEKEKLKNKTGKKYSSDSLLQLAEFKSAKFDYQISDIIKLYKSRGNFSKARTFVLAHPLIISKANLLAPFRNSAAII